MMAMKRKTALILICILVLTSVLPAALMGCGETAHSAIPVAGDDILPSDYSQEKNWMLLPQSPDKSVDVFYLYPTSWSQKNKKEPPLCRIDHKGMRSTARKNTEKQATAFETVGNIYVPFYRQVAVAFVLTQPIDEQLQYFGGVPATDAIAAFDYYIRHYNNGRPFILAGHSQGSAVMKELLFTYMSAHPEVYSRMVAAYIIGYSVTKQELQAHPYLKFARGADDTGVIISYNTEAPVLDGKNNTVLDGSIAINPITWTRGDEPASPAINPGSYMNVNGNMTKVEGLADATVNPKRGTVICSSVDRETYRGKNRAFFPLGSFHSYDYAFYYYSLRENARLRVDAFLECFSP